MTNDYLPVGTLKEYDFDESLQWDIDDIGNKEEAFNFCMKFQNFLPIYSSFCQQIYTKYEFLQHPDSSRITILPDTSNAYLHIINNVPEPCISPTPYSIIPGGAINQRGIVTFNRENRKSKDLGGGLIEIVKEYMNQGKVFTPILKNGSLHPFVGGESFQLDIFTLDFNKLRETHSKHSCYSIGEELEKTFRNFYVQTKKQTIRK